ncbi:hypothetical protein NF212_19015 [Parasalinivibrio latis]|uniref:hypothetical protein n=1 Tax=Parasalinivibrio latis TaxID=2952610 RepID=UPI0030E2DA93
MEESIDIGSQIQTSVSNPNGYMNSIYNSGKENPGTAVNFTWSNKAFNSDPFEALDTKAWPFGRVSGDVVGRMTVHSSGVYAVNATLRLRSDNYSWNMDGNGVLHNTGIYILGNNLNAPGKGNMQHGSITSQLMLNDSSIKAFSPLGVFGAASRSVNWSSPSKYHNNGEMSVNYNRDYNFYAWGK